MSTSFARGVQSRRDATTHDDRHHAAIAVPTKQLQSVLEPGPGHFSASSCSSSTIESQIARTSLHCPAVTTTAQFESRSREVAADADVRAGATSS